MSTLNNFYMQPNMQRCASFLNNVYKIESDTHTESILYLTIVLTNTHFIVSPRTAGLHVLHLRWCEKQLHRSALNLTCWCIV